MTTTTTPLPTRPHRYALGTWVASVTAMLTPGEKTRRPVQRMHLYEEDPS